MTFKGKQQNLAVALLQPINTAAVVLLGLFTMIWGFWVANPWWEVFTRAELYSALIEFAPIFVPPEIFWGCVAMTCGAITVWGASHPSYRALTIGAGIMGWHWVMIAIFYFMGDWQNTGGIVSLCFAVYAAFVYLNIKVNYPRHAHKRR